MRQRWYETAKEQVKDIKFTHHSAWICEAAKCLDVKVETIVEIGVWRCRGSSLFRREYPKAKMILVDPFLKLRKDKNEMESRMNTYALTAYKRFQRDWNTKIIRAYSHEAAELLNDKYDLVFIDSMHTYKAVKQDIELWLPKVRKGGILAGHDYGGKYKGVKQAVDEAFGDNILIGKDLTWVHLKGKF